MTSTGGSDYRCRLLQRGQAKTSQNPPPTMPSCSTQDLAQFPQISEKSVN